MNNNFSQDVAIQYFGDGIDLCQNVDEEIQKINEIEKDLSELLKNIRTKRQLFKGKSLYIIWLLFFLIFLILSLPTFLINNTMFLLSLPLSILFVFILKVYYEKKLLYKYEKLYRDAIQKHISLINELLESLMLYRDSYDEVLKNIPEKTRHPIALQIMQESLISDFSQDVQTAVMFYKERYEKLKNISDESVQPLLKKISLSETTEDDRLIILQNLEKKISLYNKNNA